MADPREPITLTPEQLAVWDDLEGHPTLFPAPPEPRERREFTWPPQQPGAR